jgi:arabinose-5-phosphate isomerase
MNRVLRSKNILNSFADTIKNIELNGSFSEAIDVILETVKNGGSIITVGMGKAGIIMKKFSSTLCSMGIPSCYLHPGEATHGDLGILTNKDVLFVASTSGKTLEVIQIIDLAKKINNKKIIGITSHPDSLLREKADIIIDMGSIEESGHLKLVPTNSTLVMLAITDCIALIAGEDKGTTKEEYSCYHHGGYLGKIARNDNNIY